MQQSQSNFSEYTNVQSFKFLLMRDAKLTLEIAAETEIIVEHFKNDKIIQQLALNKLINQINNSNKIHNEIQIDYDKKSESLKQKVKGLRTEVRDLVERLMDEFDNDQVRNLIYKYTDHNLEEIVNPYWQLIQQIKLSDIPEQQMNFLKAINKKEETLRTLNPLIFTEKDIKQAINERKLFIKEKIQALIK